MSRILKRPRAKEDLIEIWDYIAQDSQDMADAFVAAIDRKFQVLLARPGLGRKRDELEEGVRSLAAGKNVIFYRAFRDGVEIVRVLHGARDVPAVFNADD